MKQFILTLFIFLAGSLASHAVSDLAIMGLAGPVRQVVTVTAFEEMEVEQTLAFDASGNLTAVDGNPVKITRGADGTMQMIVMQDEDEEGKPAEFRVELTYDAANRPVKGVYDSIWDSWTELYAYRADGRTLSRTIDDPMEGSTVTYSYNPADVDDHGNWVVRTASSADSGTSVETRTITYK